MLFLIDHKQDKPNRLIPESKKDAQYDVHYARYVIGQGNNKLQRDRIARYRLHREFYKNNQWFLSEDTEAFLKDTTGQDRGRIRAVQNYIRPTVEQYRGNAERMNFDFKVYSISPLAKKRRDNALSKLLAYQAVSDVIPSFGEYLRDNSFPLGIDEVETTSSFEKLYTDQYVLAINRFAKAVIAMNKLGKYKIPLAKDIALGGVGILAPYMQGGDWRFKRVSPESWGFDTTSVEEDLSDSNYFFEIDYMSPTTIFERDQDLEDDHRKAIEDHVTSAYQKSYGTNEGFDTAGKVPVYTAKWKDLVVDEYGYVEDEFGQRVLKRINYIEPGQEEPNYTKKDVIPAKDLTPYQKEVLGGKETRMLYADLWRYCKFIPDEILSSKYVYGKSKNVILESGPIRYQQPDLYRSTNMMPPYFVGMWSYLDGDVLSPIDVMINPQRMINRFLSVMENQMNNSGLDGVTYDRDMTHDEAELIKNMKRGEPVGVNARGSGVQNVIGKYSSSNLQAAQGYAVLMEQFRHNMESMTGVNEAIKGNTGNPDQLVGVMQLMIQRGSLIQEPFYKALSNIYEGAYQNIVSSAKRFYIDNDTDLYDFVGDESTEVIKLAKELRNENMAISVKRVPDDDQERITVDQTLYTWIQLGLIDQPTVAKLVGKATMGEALEALKAYHKDLAEQQRIAAEQQEMMMAQQQQQQAQLGEEVQGEQRRQETREDANKEADRETKLASEIVKSRK